MSRASSMYSKFYEMTSSSWAEEPVWCISKIYLLTSPDRDDEHVCYFSSMIKLTSTI